MLDRIAMDLWKRGYTVQQIVNKLGLDQGFVQDLTDDAWGQTNFKEIVGKNVSLKEKLIDPTSGEISIGTSNVFVKELSPSGDRVLLTYPSHNISRWSEVENLKMVKPTKNSKPI